MRAAFVIAVACVAACGASPTAPEIASRLIGHGGAPVEMRRGEPSAVVIRDAGSWSDFVKQSALRAPSGRPEDPIPAISFSSEMAVALLLGQRPTSGYFARVSRLTANGDTLVVSAVEVVPCVGATVITHPLSAFAVPRSDQRVTVEWSREGPNCQ